MCANAFVCVIQAGPQPGIERNDMRRARTQLGSIRAAPRANPANASTDHHVPQMRLATASSGNQKKHRIRRHAAPHNHVVPSSISCSSNL
jgi:hypothetical protein